MNEYMDELENMNLSVISCQSLNHSIFKIFYLFIFRKRGREGSKERNSDVREDHP